MIIAPEMATTFKTRKQLGYPQYFETTQVPWFDIIGNFEEKLQWSDELYVKNLTSASFLCRVG